MADQGDRKVFSTQIPTQPRVSNIILFTQVIINQRGIKGFIFVVLKDEVCSQSPFDERFDNFDFDIDSGGEEEDEGKDEGNNDCDLDVLVLLGFDVLEDGQFHAFHLLVEPKEKPQYPHLYFRLQDAQQNDGPEYHEDEDGVQEDHLQVLIPVQHRKWNPIVTHHSIVNQHHSDHQHLQRNSKSSDMDHPYFHHIECPLHWLDCFAQWIGHNTSDVGNRLPLHEGENEKEEHERKPNRLHDHAEMEFPGHYEIDQKFE